MYKKYKIKKIFFSLVLFIISNNFSMKKKNENEENKKELDFYKQCFSKKELNKMKEKFFSQESQIQFEKIAGEKKLGKMNSSFNLFIAYARNDIYSPELNKIVLEGVPAFIEQNPIRNPEYADLETHKTNIKKAVYCTMMESNFLERNPEKIAEYIQTHSPEHISLNHMLESSKLHNKLTQNDFNDIKFNLNQNTKILAIEQEKNQNK
jgi:hypothetical protein